MPKSQPKLKLNESDCRNYIGGQIGLLINMELAEPEIIRRALVWWGNTPEAWEALYSLLNPHGDARAAVSDVVKGVVDKIKGRE